MRLKCPGCGALYEVDDDAIPPEGREVLCAACGTTWFQRREDAGSAVTEAKSSSTPYHRISPETLRILREEAEIAASLRKGKTASPPAEEVRTLPEEEELAQPAARENARTPQVSKGDKQDQPKPEDKAEPGEADGGEAVEVVIEEAAAVKVETRVLKRKRRGRRLIEEIAPEKIPVPSPAKEGEILARESGEDGALASAGGGLLGRSADRGDREDHGESHGLPPLPRDLAAHEEHGETLGKAGFWLGVLIVAIAIGVYFLAPRIAAAVPDLAGPIGAYVDMVDRARLWLDEQVRILTDRLWQLIGSIL